MGVDRGVAGAAFAAAILSVGTACLANKSEDEIQRKCLQKKRKRRNPF